MWSGKRTNLANESKEPNKKVALVVYALKIEDHGLEFVSKYHQVVLTFQVL